MSGWDLHCERLIHSLLRVHQGAAGSALQQVLQQYDRPSEACIAVTSLLIASFKAASSALQPLGGSAWKSVILLWVKPDLQEGEVC